jgi:antitoxin VapB
MRARARLHLQAMGMNIKDPLVHAMARELAAHRGTSVTDAVRQALRAELDRCRTAAPGHQEAARRQALLQLLNRCRELPWPDQGSGAELQAQLYDETGLPA